MSTLARLTVAEYDRMLHAGVFDQGRRVEFIEWYRVYRQHDVCRSGGAYDNATMGLLCPGQDYQEYIFTIYEYMCETQDLAQLYNFGYVSGGLNWLRGSELYIPGYIGMTAVMDDLFKKYCGSNDLAQQHGAGVFK